MAPTVLNLADATVPDNMQGRAFLADHVKRAKADAYSARDRMDERYDMQRSVRSKEFKYIRYYESYKPYTQYMNTPEQGEIMNAIREASINETLPKAGLHIVLDKKPDEELFGLLNDPWELNNLADDPDYKDKLIEMRTAHARWSDNTKDSGLIPETIMRSWEKKYDKSIFDILRGQDVPINEIREAALGKDQDLLTKTLSHQNEAVRYWAAISLGNIKGLKNRPETLHKLNSMLGDPTPAVQIAAARALCKTGQVSGPVEVLIKQLNSEDEWVRLLAAQVLDEIGEDARPAEGELQKRIDEDKNKYVVRVANRALNVMNETQYKVK